MELYQHTLQSPFGNLRVVASNTGLAALLFENHRAGKVNLPHPIVNDPQHSIIKLTELQLNQYFFEGRREFSLPIHFVVGTPFQHSVWQSLRNIAYGETLCYSEQARRYLNQKNGARAVALANSKNPISIVIPCHRVVGKNGELRGYAGGIEVKRGLLKLEGVRAI